MVDDDSMVVTNVGCCEAGLYKSKGDYDAALPLYVVDIEPVMGLIDGDG